MVTTWLFILLIGILLGAAALGWLLSVRRSRTGGVAVAHTQRARQHPRFQRRLLMLRVALAAMMAAGLFSGVAAAYLAGRPSDEVNTESKLATRDIMLCLDVSGSVIEFDAEIVRSFSRVVENFEGERVGMMVWNSGARLVFPLTSDYELVLDQLEQAENALADAYEWEEFAKLVAGTEAGIAYGSSLIGDGLAACTQSFDQQDEERSRSMIFATDNELAGNPVFTLDEAVQLAADRGIVVHGLYTASPWRDDDEEMKESLESRGMYYYKASDASAADGIVKAVQDQDAVDLGSVGETLTVDTPGRWPIFIGLASLVLLGVAWRFKL
ncbi:hypothetical protein J2S70_001075 [Trueperella bonasi]|uniref:VWFA domain-containing protein n=1 Tax=Trueperella bonasi TaxID=312286 RepID=A0ABT9NI62_9ACTO|nr:VWA domain-containing protein [Trueperella bonasi]MDP9806493.1 hypothetical protein [Trueperella bonasi]